MLLHAVLQDSRSYLAGLD